MKLNLPFFTLTFKFYLVFAVVVGVTAFAILAILYASFSYDYFNEVHSAIIEEVDSAAISYENEGVAGFEAFVAKRTQSRSFDQFHYLLVDKNNNKMAGNLDAWPKFQTFGDGWLSFEKSILQSGDKDIHSHEFVGRSIELDDGNKLIAARLYSDVIERIYLVGGILLQSMLVTILVGTLGGAVISTIFQRRLEEVNSAIHTIMNGDLSERIPVDSRSSDFEDLIENLNVMLDRIEQLMKGVRQVSDNIAHDLRTPLTRLRNNLATLDQDCNPEKKQIVEDLIGEAEHLLTTFNALLRIAQVESGNRRSEFGDVNLQKIVADVAELYEPLAADKMIALKYNVDKHRVAETKNELVADMISGDKDLLFQMVANLVDNAIKYTPAHGEVSLCVKVRSGRIYLTVSDSGSGIPDEYKDKVFQRFFRVDKSRGKEPGNGLGLSLVWAVVKLHNGAIELAHTHRSLSGEQHGLAVKVSFATKMLMMRVI